MISSDSSPTMSQVDGACFGKPDVNDVIDITGTAELQQAKAAAAPLPSFLQITETGKISVISQFI
jgi:hypothetical protein